MCVLLSAEDVSAGYGDRVIVKQVSLRVQESERILLIGPNGCGKTTLLKVLAGMLPRREGKILFKGQRISQASRAASPHPDIGYLMQNKNIFPSLTVEENLHISGWHRQHDHRRSWILEVLPVLNENLRRRAGLLSGGERQALAIGMVLMRPIDLLLLDEPTAGLSPKAAAMVLEIAHEVQERFNITTIMVEHNLRLVYQWVSRVLVMNEGRVVADEHDPSALLNHEHLLRYYFR